MCTDPSKNYLKVVAEAKGMMPPEKSHADKVSCMVSTVNENKLGYTKRQFEDAKCAPRLQMSYCRELQACSMTEYYQELSCYHQR